MILLTGGSGFLGSAILELGRDRGMNFRTVGRTEFGAPDHFCADLTKRSIPAPAFDGVESVIHVAGLAHQFGAHADQREGFFSVNADAVGNVVQSAVEHRVGHVILVSSMAVYGPGTGKAHTELDPCHPSGYYAESKLAGETRAIEAVTGTDCRLTILRMTTVYGEGDRGNVNRLIQAIDSGRFMRVGDCQNRKCLIYRDDAAAACLLSLSNDAPDSVSIFNVASAEVSMLDVVAGICEHLGRKLPLRIPNPLVNGLSMFSAALGHKGPIARINDTVKKFNRSDIIDGSKFRAKFGFQAKVELSEGLRRQIVQYQHKRT